MTTAGSAFDRRVTSREILALAVPATLALAADPLLSLVDTALVGHLGTAELAAVGICAAALAVVSFVFTVLTYGTTAEVARLRGAGRPEAAAAHALQALWLAVGGGLVATLVLEAVAPALLRVMGADGEIAAHALVYLRIRALAVLPLCVVLVGHGAFRGLKNTRTPLVVTLVANGANGFVDWLLIYPVGLGVAGAAWGTVLAQVGAATAFLLLARRSFPTPDLKIDPPAMRRIARISRDLFLRTASLVAAITLTTAVAARMGSTVVAAHRIAQELWFLLALVLDGFAIAGQAMIATALGARDHARARADARSLVWWGLAAGTAAGAVFFALAGPLPRVFTDDPEVIAAVRSIWWIVAAMQPLGGVVFVLDGVFMGAGDFGFLLVATASAALLALAPIAVVALIAGWGLTGIWAGMAALILVRCATLVWRLRGARWATG